MMFYLGLIFIWLGGFFAGRAYEKLLYKKEKNYKVICYDIGME